MWLQQPRASFALNKALNPDSVLHEVPSHLQMTQQSLRKVPLNHHIMHNIIKLQPEHTYPTLQA